MMTKTNKTNAAIKETASRRLLRRTISSVFPLKALIEKTNDPHKALENLERASAAATLWIFWGIVIEFGALLWFPHELWERVAGLVATALIGLGLVFEYIIIGRAIIAGGEAQRLSDEKVAAAEDRAAQAHLQAGNSMAMAADARNRSLRFKKEIAEANARAAEAQLELAKFRKPWELPVWKLPEYEKILGPFAGTPFVIHVIDNIDQRQMAATLSQAFSWARWEPRQSPAPKPLAPGIVDVPPWITGVDVRINDTRVSEWRPAADAIAQVFALSEIDVIVHETNGVQPDAIHVFIGRKA